MTMPKTFKALRHDLNEARRKAHTRKVGMPTWAKAAAIGLLAKVKSDGSSVGANTDPLIRDKKLSDQITTSAAISTLAIAINSNDKSLLSKAKSVTK